MTVPMADVVVSGGGIGALAAALSISRQRHRVLVLEPDVPPDRTGVGLQLTPGALRALHHLGVGEALRERLVPLDGLRVHDGTTGRRLAASRLGDAYLDWFGTPYAAAPWAALYRPLREACAASPLVRFRPGSAVAGFAQDEHRVFIRLAGGGRLEADALIGAEGTCSPVRRQLSGGGDPAAPWTLYQTEVDLDRLPERAPEEARSGAVTLWSAPGWGLSSCPVSERRLALTAVRSTAPEDGGPAPALGAPVAPDRVLRELSGAPEPARALLGLARRWTAWVPCDPGPEAGPDGRCWSGRVALTGGTARSTELPFPCPGTSRALEDALLLGDLLDCDAADFPQALRMYAARHG
ncbi:FAD-dependent monooxygenase [Streptomyces aidingensis]|uniref:Salicylate hydroxylase n=1 Tax=Streptomyces aidingensis TaxID=910347 RepID=A0A1I1FEC9_9ACTN|nr:FAD-dependent monooxygenase [Streptomyces aidingensis]SFB97757.1 salicylate hydroxylase [Streptomyces aidingensis]